MPALEVEVVDVGAQGLGDAQPVEGQQRRPGVIAGRAEAGEEIAGGYDLPTEQIAAAIAYEEQLRSLAA